MAIILANDGIDAAAAETLTKLGHDVDTTKYEGDALLQRLKEVDCVVVRSATKIREPQIEAAAEGGKLKLIIRAGVGVDNINVDQAEAKGIEVRNTPAASSNAVAELVIGHMFSLARNLHRANRSMARGEWLKKEYKGTEIMGKTLGILGLGRIGRCLAEKAKALGMKVIYFDLFRWEEGEKEHGYEYMELEDVLKNADYISLHLPFTGEAIINEAAFDKMKDGVYIIDAARGGVMDEKALLKAIESGKVAGAALDVFAVEPLDCEDVMHCDKLSLSPHIGAATAEAQARIGDIIVELIKEKF